MLELIFKVFCLVTAFYLVFPFLLVILSLMKKEKYPPSASRELDFACIITAYQHVQIALPLIISLMKQNYSHYLIYLVADACDLSGITLEHEKVIVLKPEEKLGSKVKSIQHALNHFKRNHDVVAVFDPDNLAPPDFLKVLNQYLTSGFVAVQGRRIAKNLDTIYACADATGEIYKNYVERYAPYLLGSSPTIAGSGMAVKTPLFREYLQEERITASLSQNKVIAAEDKILQNFLVSRGYQIAFANTARLYDEKITSAQQVERQRSRWLYSYFENLPYAARLFLKGLTSFNINQLLFGLTTSSPPLFLLLLTGLLLTVISIFVHPLWLHLMINSIWIFTANIFLVLWLSDAPKAIWRALWGLPLFIFRQCIALLRMGQSRRDFLPTRHKKVITLEEMENP
ncbi:MAG: hypothetical protein KatS3mg031_0325 [Chitinophagales bacterium]|nr:MAG: hypothetical protein KatS3mg031_0325 [Chitinophagales bacterium]